MGVEEDAQAFFNVIMEALRSDGWYDYVKRNLVGFVSDGAR